MQGYVGRTGRIRTTLSAILTSSLVAALLLSTASPVNATDSTARKITSLKYTNPAAQLQLRNSADTANATFSSGTESDAVGSDEYVIRLYHSAISLIPTVSLKAEWECDVVIESGAGTEDDENCSATDLAGGDEVQITIIVFAESGDDNEYEFNVDVYETDVTLEDLVSDLGTLVPAFNSGTTSYSIITGQSEIDLDPDTSSAAAEVVCKKGSVTLDDCVAALVDGVNTISITVTNAASRFSRVYTVRVTKVPTSNAEIETIELSHGGLLTAASTNSTFTRTQFSPTVIAYDLTSNDDEISIVVDLKNEDATFDCDASANLTESSDSNTNPDGDSCDFDITGANADSGFTVSIIVDPEDTSAEKTYTFTVRLSNVITADIPALDPDDETILVGKRVGFNPDGLTLRDDFSNETAVQYQWYLCDDEVLLGDNNPGTVPSGCVKKSLGGTSATYTPTSADAGKHLIGALVGQPGNVLAYSASTLVLALPGLAVSTVLPTPFEAGLVAAEVDGDPIELDNIDTADFVGIEDAATDLAFQWYRCSSEALTATVGASVTVPSTCKKISGETEDSYTPAGNDDPLLTDAGKFIRVRVTLQPSGTSVRYVVLTRSTNKVYGPATHVSGPGTPAAPSLTSTAPEKTITAKVNAGSWIGTPAVDLTIDENLYYDWFACNAPIEEESSTIPSDRMWRDEPRCYSIGETTKSLVVGTELCNYYLVVGVQVNNEDFRGKGGWSDWFYSATSSTKVAGSACY